MPHAGLAGEPSESGAPAIRPAHEELDKGAVIGGPGGREDAIGAPLIGGARAERQYQVLDWVTRQRNLRRLRGIHVMLDAWKIRQRARSR